jgi:hypothetical protein
VSLEHDETVSRLHAVLDNLGFEQHPAAQVGEHELRRNMSKSWTGKAAISPQRGPVYARNRTTSA